MLPTWLSLIFACALIVVEAWANVSLFRKKKTIDKTKRNVLRTAIGAAFAFVTYLNVGFAARYLAFLAPLFLALFNPVIGKMWKNDWWYLNGTDFTDKFLSGLPKWLRLVVLGSVLFIGFWVWQMDYFSMIRIGILEPGFFRQFATYIDYLI